MCDQSASFQEKYLNRRCSNTSHVRGKHGKCGLSCAFAILHGVRANFGLQTAKFVFGERIQAAEESGRNPTAPRRAGAAQQGSVASAWLDRSAAAPYAGRAPGAGCWSTDPPALWSQLLTRPRCFNNQRGSFQGFGGAQPRPLVGNIYPLDL